jgi:hypothetical protein
MDWAKLTMHEALIFIRNVAKTKYENGDGEAAWETVYLVAKDAIEGKTTTLDELRAP